MGTVMLQVQVMAQQHLNSSMTLQMVMFRPDGG